MSDEARPSDSQFGSKFPNMRLRRLRRSDSIREMIRETGFSVKDLVYPMFVVHGENIRHPIPPMPGQFQYSIDTLVEEVKAARDLGILSVLLFGIPNTKDSLGTEAGWSEGVVQKAVAAIRENVSDMVIITDVCLCEYTDHGHCGILSQDGDIDNDRTVEALGQIAISHADSGADIVAPSGMMDGQVGAIRFALDEGDHSDVAIMSYAAKFSSAFYGPFRVAGQSNLRTGNRNSHQLDPANSRQAMRELHQDAAEGADLLIIKPSMAYLDIVSMARRRFDLPLAAYNVSGEYSMLKAAVGNGWIEEEAAILETLSSIRRAGADLIITYHAVEAAKILQRLSHA